MLFTIPHPERLQIGNVWFWRNFCDKEDIFRRPDLFKGHKIFLGRENLRGNLKLLGCGLIILQMFTVLYHIMIEQSYIERFVKQWIVSFIRQNNISNNMETNFYRERSNIIICNTIICGVLPLKRRWQHQQHHWWKQRDVGMHENEFKSLVSS